MYKVCDTCTAAIANDDFSGFTPEDEASVIAWLEIVGMLALGEQVDPGGYWDCAACGAVEIGTAQIMEPVS